MATIKIDVSSLSGTALVEIADGSTVADLVAQGHVQESAVVRSQGRDVPTDAPLEDGGRYVATPPAAKHGATIKVDVSSLSGTATIEVEDGSTASDLVAQGHVQEGANLRSQGRDLSGDAPLEDGGRYVATPPAAKHGE